MLRCPDIGVHMKILIGLLCLISLAHAEESPAYKTNPLESNRMKIIASQMIQGSSSKKPILRAEKGGNDHPNDVFQLAINLNDKSCIKLMDLLEVPAQERLYISVGDLMELEETDANNKLIKECLSASVREG